MGPASLPFAALLKRHRLAAGLTQEALAERAGLSARAVSDLERDGGRTPRLETIALLADALGLTPEQRAALLAGARPDMAHDGNASGGRQPHRRLPVPPTPLLGRERETVEVAALLRQGDVRLLTVMGTGGVGKTRLALEVARAVAPSFADGVYFVALAPLRDPTLVLPTIAQALDVRETAGRTLAASLRAALCDRDLLLLLDNVEHVAPAAAALADLLASSSGLRVLATSRVALRLRGEHRYPLAPLALPAPAAHLTLTADLRSAAVELFVQRARAAVPDFALSAANASAVAAICQRLNGLPLALELAAARLTLLSPAELLARLDQQLLVLTGGAYDLPERQQTLRATLAWSHDLLSASEAAMFRRLATFVAGWTLAAAQAVCAADPTEADAVLDSLGALVDQSLVGREIAGSDRDNAEPRFAMLEAVRQYAEEQLSASGEADQFEQQFATYYLALGEAAAAQLIGTDQGTWLAQLEREHDNLRATLVWALGSEATPGKDNALGLRLVGLLWRFWHTRGYLSEGRQWLELALTCSDLLPAATRADLLSRTATFAWEQGDHERARELFEESLTLRRAVGDTSGVAASLNGLGMVAWRQGAYARSAALLTESLTLQRKLGHAWAIAATLSNLGILTLQQGDHLRSAMLFEESLALRHHLKDALGIADVLSNLGVVALHRGEYSRAIKLCLESLTQQRDLGFKRGIAENLEIVGLVLGTQGQPHRATRLWGAAHAIREAIGTSLGPLDLRHYEQFLADVRPQLSAVAYATEWGAGHNLSLVEMITEALTGSQE